MNTSRKAYEQGLKDGAEKVRDDQQELGGALTAQEVEGWFRAGQVGADEHLINALGLDEAAKLFGVRHASAGWDDALEQYNAGYKAGALKQIRG